MEKSKPLVPILDAVAAFAERECRVERLLARLVAKSLADQGLVLTSNQLLALEEQLAGIAKAVDVAGCSDIATFALEVASTQPFDAHVAIGSAEVTELSRALEHDLTEAISTAMRLYWEQRLARWSCNQSVH